ncbi:hypothetical protein QFZ20_005492 [Flavobacterium sp. W4I14]|nr:hypothetical protein [Flavobacterium sp. W4I14]
MGHFKCVSDCLENKLLIPKSLQLKTTSYTTSFLAPKESIYNLTFRDPSLKSL